MNAGKHTPLHEAAYRGFDDIMLELLLRGADPHAASNQKRTPLHEACMQGTPVFKYYFVINLVNHHRVNEVCVLLVSKLFCVP